jgi:tripeptide aminopeptidase
MLNPDRLVETFVRLCRFNSPPREEGAIVIWTRGFLEGLGLEVVEDRAGEAVGGNANNLIATLPSTVEGAPKLLFSAHFDTVEPTPDIQIVEENGVIRTTGKTILGADDKAGMAPILEAVQTIVERDLPHGQIQLALTICEEIGLLGAKNLDFSLVDAEMGFVLDAGPPVGGFVVAAPGHTKLEVAITGRAAHAGVCPEEGISAIEVASEAIAGMRLGRMDEVTTANIGIFQGGQAFNIVAPSVSIVGEARSFSAEKLDAQLSHMISRFEEAAARRGASATHKITPTFASFRMAESDAVLQLGMAASRAIGLTPDLRQGGGGSDGNVFNEHGVPTVVVATGMQKYHTHDEFCKIDDLVKTAELLLSIVAEAQQ